jgi:hypothetical protein
MNDLRERVNLIKINEGISFKHICQQIGFQDEAYFCRWRKGKPKFILDAVYEQKLDEYLSIKGY